MGQFLLLIQLGLEVPDLPLLLSNGGLDLFLVEVDQLHLVPPLALDLPLQVLQLVLQFNDLCRRLQGRVLGLLDVGESCGDDRLEVIEEDLCLIVVELGLAVLLYECLAVGVVHLAEEVLAELVVLLDGLPPVDLLDDLLLLADVLLQLGPVALEGVVAGYHVEALEPGWGKGYFLSVLRRILLSRL